MSNLPYYSYEGFGTYAAKNSHSQAVRIGPILKLAGQGGWDPLTTDDTPAIPPSAPEELAKAFATVEHALHDAGASQGWNSVYALRIYYTETLEGFIGDFQELMRRYRPTNKPIVTAIGVRELAFGMKFEIEVEAYLAEEK